MEDNKEKQEKLQSMTSEVWQSFESADSAGGAVIERAATGETAAIVNKTLLPDPSGEQEKKTAFREGALFVPQPKNEYGIAARSVDRLFGNAPISVKQTRYLLKQLTDQQREMILQKIGKKLRNQTIKDSICWTIDNTEEGNIIYNMFSVQESKMLLAIQKCLSDQTEDPHKIIQDGRKFKRSRKNAAPDSTGQLVKAGQYSVVRYGQNPGMFEPKIQKAIADSDFKVFAVITVTVNSFLRDYMGLENPSAEARIDFLSFLEKLHSGRYAEFDKDYRGKTRFYAIQSTLLNWHVEDGKIIIVLGPLFCNMINNYRRVPENQAEIFKTIGNNKIMFNMYLFLLNEMSYNDYGEKIINRPVCRKVEIPEEELLRKFTEPTDKRRRSVKLESIYRAFDMFHSEFNMLCRKVKVIERDGVRYVEFYVNRGIFVKQNNAKNGTE